MSPSQAPNPVPIHDPKARSLMKRNPLTIAVGAVLLIIFGLLLFMFQVRVTEVAVVTTFGKPTRPITEPGPYFKWPWPIQKVHKFDKRIHNFESKFEQVLTSDGYSLLIMVYTGWHISRPEVFFPRFEGSVKKAEESLDGLVRNAYIGVVGLHPLSHFVSTDEKELRFVEIEKEMLDRIQKDAISSGYGVQVDFLGIKRLGLPEAVTEAVFKQMQAEREVLISQINSQGTEQSSAIRTAAKLESAKLLADAEAEATRVRSLGEAEAAKSFRVFEQNPELANFLLKLNALKSFLKEKTTLILDPNTSPLELLRDTASHSPQPAKSNAHE
jgi:modulator of FtsH protease HflC